MVECVSGTHEALGLKVHGHAVVGGLTRGGLIGDGLGGEVDQVTVAP